MKLKQALFACLVSVFAIVPAHGETAQHIVGDSGLPSLSWFKETSSDLRADIESARESGKFLALVWEQAGCYYCKQMREVNFAVDEVANFVRAHFELVQFDMHGDRMLTDLKGEISRESELARRNRVTGTPTIQFLTADGREVFRMPGYAKPAVFLAAFQYVKEGGYHTLSFRDWVKAEIKRRAES